MKIGKPKSKRVPVRLRHKIEKASTAKQRKQRKEAKKNPQWKSRVKKDPGIPNLFPYKAKVLAEIEETERRKEEEQMRRREVAKAQREGRNVVEVDGAVGGVAVDGEGDAVLLDDEDVQDQLDDEDMEVEHGGSGNPMAALLASASARADAYASEDDDDDRSDEQDEDDEEGEGWTGISEPASSKMNNKSTIPPGTNPTTKGLPKQALADPVKSCTKLLQQMQQTQDGIQRLIEHYQMPPLVTAGSDLPTRFLVEVARKRGRLGRGGVPNLHSAALTVLGDLNEGRVVLPAVAVEKSKAMTGVKRKGGKGEVTVVETMAEPFRIEGLWGGDGDEVATEEAIVVER